ATLPGDWDLAHAIRLGIKPFAELGANSEALSGSQVDSPCSCRAIFESAPVAMLQSRKGVTTRFVCSIEVTGDCSQCFTISGLPIYGLELAFQTLFLSGAPKE